MKRYCIGNASQIKYLKWGLLFDDISKTRPPFETKIAHVSFIVYNIIIVKTIERFQKPKILSLIYL